MKPADLVAYRNRYMGCFLGLAAGDSLGTTLEFTPPGAGGKRLTTIVGGGPFDLKPGEWTDDTSMALCLADGLLARGSFNARDALDRWVEWYRSGVNSVTGKCFDIGGTTASALRCFEDEGRLFRDPAPKEAGNGCLMRMAPVVFAYAMIPGAAEVASALQCKTTHGAPVAMDCCRLFATYLVRALQGDGKAAIFAPVSEVPAYVRQPLCAEVECIAGGSFHHPRTNPGGAIRGSGYAVDALEAALWAFYHSRDFRDGALLAVHLGQDADTTAAIYGQIAGAYYGIGGIPKHWRDVLAWGHVIQGHAVQLLELAIHKEEELRLILEARP